MTGNSERQTEILNLHSEYFQRRNYWSGDKNNDPDTIGDISQ